MKNQLYVRSLAIVSLLAAGAASAQVNENPPPVRLTFDGNTPPPNRFGLSYRPGLNISAKFKNLGGFPALTVPGPAIGGTNHIYEDGYNFVDVTGNAGGVTWNWGYEHDSQVPGDDFIYFHSSSSAPGVSSKSKSDDPHHGVEFTYNRLLGQSDPVRWGLEAAFNYAGLNIEDKRSYSGTVSQTTDKYALNGVIPPQPPYHGTTNGPGPVISDIPIRSVGLIPSGASISGKHELDADIYGFRLGPYVEMPLNKRLAFSLSGGLALANVNSDFKFSEKVTIPGAGSTIKSGSGSHSDWLYGGFVGGNFSYALTEAVSIFAGAQYQNVGRYSHTISSKTDKTDTKKAELDLGESVFLTLGVGFSF